MALASIVSGGVSGCSWVVNGDLAGMLEVPAGEDHILIARSTATGSITIEVPAPAEGCVLSELVSLSAQDLAAIQQPPDRSVPAAGLLQIEVCLAALLSPLGSPSPHCPAMIESGGQ